MNQSSSGSYILIIKDKPYEVILQDEGRLVNHVIDPDLEKKERWYTINGKKIPEINVLWHVKGITSEIALSLDTLGQILLLKDYMFGHRTVASLKNHQDSSVVNAKSDYDEAVFNIFKDEPNYVGSSRSSFQFAVKILKAKLQMEGKVFEQTEKLHCLAKKLEDENIEEIQGIISNIQKYSNETDGEISVTCGGAVSAVRSSLELFSKLYPEKKIDDQVPKFSAGPPSMFRPQSA